MESIASYVASVAANQQAIAQAGQQARQRLGGRPEGALHLELRRLPHVRGGRGRAERSGRTSTSSRSPQTAIAEQIRIGGGGMPPFEGQLTDEQIQALAEFVFENRK